MGTTLYEWNESKDFRKMISGIRENDNHGIVRKTIFEQTTGVKVEPWIYNPQKCGICGSWWWSLSLKFAIKHVDPAG